jgi:molybdopterin molybdotransferase
MEHAVISYHECLEILKKAVGRGVDEAADEVDLRECVGRILAEDLLARENSPSFDNSAMDGFAVNMKSIPNLTAAHDGWIPVQAVLGAGENDIRLANKVDAIEIMTGAPIPAGEYDSVVRVENVEAKVDRQGRKQIRLSSTPIVGDNIRRAGEDSRTGDVLLRKGERIRARHLLVLATQGISRVKVKRPIQVSVVSTGKELVDFRTKELGFGQIRNSTGIYLEAELSGPLFNLKHSKVVPDDQVHYLEAVKALFDEGVELLISTGAVSMGAYDFVKPALKSLGAKVHFHKCAIRPGKPILFATIEYQGKTRYIFGLPGNPVSTMIGFRFFIKPFIDFLLVGETERPSMAVLASDTKKAEGLRCFLKAKMSKEGPETKIESLKGQASFMVSPLIQSDAWLVLPEEGAFVKRGTHVEVYSI